MKVFHRKIITPTLWRYDVTKSILSKRLTFWQNKTERPWEEWIRQVIFKIGIHLCPQDFDPRKSAFSLMGRKLIPAAVVKETN